MLTRARPADEHRDDHLGRSVPASLACLIDMMPLRHAQVSAGIFVGDGTQAEAARLWKLK